MSKHLVNKIFAQKTVSTISKNHLAVGTVMLASIGNY